MVTMRTSRRTTSATTLGLLYAALLGVLSTTTRCCAEASKQFLRTRRSFHGADGRLAASLQVSEEEEPSEEEEGASQEYSAFKLEERDRRPHQGGEADFVEFGVLLRQLYNVDMAAGSFSADIVMTWRWTDPRNSALVAKGHKSLTLSAKRAEEKIWVPDCGISNHALGGVEVISSAIVIERTGVTTRVERVIADLKNTFSAAAFPFDSQVLVVTVGSKTFLKDELQLSPMTGPAWSGIKGGTFDRTDFYLNGTELIVFGEVDGILAKSRGQLRISVQRDPSSYIGGSLVPEILVLAISYSVFWFPLTAPFAMPRVATALIAFLSLMTLALKTNSELPVAAGLTWIDLLETSVQSLMFFTVCLNIVALAGFHSFECKNVAEAINHELKIAFPLLLAIVLTICCFKTDGTHLGLMTAVIQLILALFAVFYVGFCLFRLWIQVNKNNAAAAAKAAEAAKAEEAGIRSMRPSSEAPSSPPDSPGKRSRT